MTPVAEKFWATVTSTTPTRDRQPGKNNPLNVHGRIVYAEAGKCFFAIQGLYTAASNLIVALICDNSFPTVPRP